MKITTRYTEASGDARIERVVEMDVDELWLPTMDAFYEFVRGMFYVSEMNGCERPTGGGVDATFSVEAGNNIKANYFVNRKPVDMYAGGEWCCPKCGKTHYKQNVVRVGRRFSCEFCGQEVVCENILEEQ